MQTAGDHELLRNVDGDALSWLETTMNTALKKLNEK